MAPPPTTAHQTGDFPWINDICGPSLSPYKHWSCQFYLNLHSIKYTLLCGVHQRMRQTGADQHTYLCQHLFWHSESQVLCSASAHGPPPHHPPLSRLFPLYRLSLPLFLSAQLPPADWQAHRIRSALSRQTGTRFLAHLRFHSFTKHLVLLCFLLAHAIHFQCCVCPDYQGHFAFSSFYFLELWKT